jgi:haloalkane dehalogenase
MDLVGFGQSDGEGYAILDQVTHLNSFIDALNLQNVVLVTHDWGAGIGLIWAAGNRDNISGFATLEGALPPVYPRPDIDSFGKAAPLFRRMLDPIEGPKAIQDENVWIETIMPGSVLGPLSDQEMAAYRAPFPTPESRTPIYDMTLSIPIGGKPAKVVAAFEDAALWWKQTEIPKLILYATPGRLLTEQQAEWAEANLKNVATVNVGPGIHFVQEDSPEAIAKALDLWLDRLPPQG